MLLFCERERHHSSLFCRNCRVYFWIDCFARLLNQHCSRQLVIAYGALSVYTIVNVSPEIRMASSESGRQQAIMDKVGHGGSDDWLADGFFFLRDAAADFRQQVSGIVSFGAFAVVLRKRETSL